MSRGSAFQCRRPRTGTGTGLVQMAANGELQMAARRYKAGGSLAVSAARKIVRLPTAGR